jgi:hypothetical protein
MAKRPNRKTAVTTLPSKPPSVPIIARTGRVFHAHRTTSSFISDPPGFQTEKDPRGAASTVWFDLPTATGLPPYHLDLKSVLNDNAIEKIASNKRLVFHTVGDTGGVNTTTYQAHVTSYMELDFSPDDSDGANPSFFYHLGDVVYYDGEIKNYYWEFYEPYLHYPAPVFAIPGNHDGDVDPNDEFNKPSDSLKGFVRNFCAQAAIHLPEADDAPRDAMTQPNVFWTLETDLATIVGLYTNVPEGGRLGQNQTTWLRQELAAAPKDRALILALHHPLYSAYGHHPGSQHLKTVLDDATQAAGRVPDLILSGHVHNYQRFTGHINGKNVPCLVVGAGGYNQKLHGLSRRMFDPDGVPYKFADGPETLDCFNDFQHGYLTVDVRPDKIICQYVAIDDPTQATMNPTEKLDPYDEFEIPLK